MDGFLRSVVTVKRVTLQAAIEQFISFRKGKTVATEGRRPQLSFDHWRNTGCWLRELAQTFPGHAVCDYALYADEGLTAKEAGNSPAMVHKNYKGLATKAEAEKWFAVAPPKPAQNVIALPTTA